MLPLVYNYIVNFLAGCAMDQLLGRETATTFLVDKPVTLVGQFTS